MERADVGVKDEDARGFGWVELLDFVPPPWPRISSSAASRRRVTSSS
jgi:hypothetical protein